MIDSMSVLSDIVIQRAKERLFLRTSPANGAGNSLLSPDLQIQRLKVSTVFGTFGFYKNF